MKNPKIIFGIILIGAFVMKAWWIFLPMFGFALGWLARQESERKEKKS